MDKKKIIIGSLCVLIMVMAVAYALLGQELFIKGTAIADSNWRVEITDIKEISKKGEARTISTGYTATTATFSNAFKHPGDKITYEVTVTNKGSIDAVLAEDPIVNVTNSDVFMSTVRGIRHGYILSKDGGTQKLVVSVMYNNNVTEQPQKTSNTTTIILNYEQNLGQVQPEYQSYSVGDKITFASSDWYVLNDSNDENDYVTVIKETPLTSQELGNYARNSSNKMYFYYDDDTCSIDDSISPAIMVTGGCKTEYRYSFIKEMLDQRYLTVLGEENLKEVDGYMIRLLTKKELEDNFGYSFINDSIGFNPASGITPTWLYQDASTSNNDFSGYWLMPEGDKLYTLLPNGNMKACNLFNYVSVRPVINLLKISFEN